MEMQRIAANSVVGINQVKRAVERGIASKVFLAEDTDIRVLEPVLRACASMEIIPEYVGTRDELGKRCGIGVGASAVAVCETCKLI